jgi:hypothetical protein
MFCSLRRQSAAVKLGGGWRAGAPHLVRSNKIAIVPLVRPGRTRRGPGEGIERGKLTSDGLCRGAKTGRHRECRMLPAMPRRPKEQ